MLQRRISPAKKYMRRTLQIIALIGTIVVGIVALALIASQTSWFRDWLRRFAVREAGNYVNGTVSIGSLGGNLFYGVQLGDVAIDVNGEHVITLKQVEIKYSLSERPKADKKLLVGGMLNTLSDIEVSLRVDARIAVEHFPRGVFDGDRVVLVHDEVGLVVVDVGALCVVATQEAHWNKARKRGLQLCTIAHQPSVDAPGH